MVKNRLMSHAMRMLLMVPIDELKTCGGGVALEKKQSESGVETKHDRFINRPGAFQEPGGKLLRKMQSLPEC